MASITVNWPAEQNEHGRPLLWFGSWLQGNDGAEGAWFYSGHGGKSGSYPVPAGATGLRVRRWPNEGLDAEYVDILKLDEVGELSPQTLDFDVAQPYSHLVFERHFERQ
jgi:hypothetical protein